MNSLHTSLQYLPFYCCKITPITLISSNPVNSLRMTLKVPSSSLLRNNTRHIDNLHSCEQPPHDSSVPPSLLLRNYTPHIANSFCCKCTNKSSVSPILSPIKPAILAATEIIQSFKTHVIFFWGMVTHRQELQSGQNFCDVTLSCDDNQILSHQVIIAPIKPFGRNIYD